MEASRVKLMHVTLEQPKWKNTVKFKQAVKTKHAERQVWNGVPDVMKVSSCCKSGLTLTDCSDLLC